MRFSVILILFFCHMQMDNLYSRSLQEIKNSGIIKVAVDGSTPLYSFYEKGKLVGIEVDLAYELASRLHLKIEWTVQPFNTLLLALSKDRFDLIATSYAITPERSQVVDFITPHLCTGAIIVSKAGGPKTISELIGKKVVIPVGTVYADYLKNVQGIKEIKTVPTEIDGFQNLLAGRADAWITEKFLALKTIQNSKEKIQNGDLLHKQVNAMAIAKRNRELQDEINRILKIILNDGTYLKITKKYLNEDVRCE